MENYLKQLLRLSFVMALTACTSLKAQNNEINDPSRPEFDMLEIMRELNNKGQPSRLTDDGKVDRLDIDLVGLVAADSGRDSGGVAIIKHEDDDFFIIVEGQTLRIGNIDLTASIIDSNGVVLRDNRSNQDFTVRSIGNSNIEKSDNELALVDFSEVPIPLALKALSYETKLKIALSKAARDTKATIYLQNVSAMDALKSLVVTHKLYLSPVDDSDIIRIQTVEEFARGATSFSDERIKIFDLSYPNSRDIVLAIRDIYGERVRISERIDESQESSQFLNQDIQQRLQRFDIIDGRSQNIGSLGNGNNQNRTNQNNANGLNGLNGANGLNGLNNRNQQNRNNRFSTNAQNQSFQEITDEEIAILEGGSADLIESLNLAKADIFITTIDRLNKIIVRTRDQKTMDEIEKIVIDLDQPIKLVLLEAQILQVNLDDGLDTALEWNYQSSDFTAAGFDSLVQSTGSSLLLNYVDMDFDAQLRILQDKNKLTVLGKPTLLIANNEVSRIFIGEEVPVVTGVGDSRTIVTDEGNVVNFFNVETENRAVGSTLLITPNINDDQTVALRLLQEESQIIKDGANILAATDANELGSVSIDVVSSQSISGTFVAANNKTIAVGGLIRETLSDRKSQIPIIGDIPLLGRLFRNQSTFTEREEIVLLLTPRIIERLEDSKVTTDYLERSSLHPNADDLEGTLGTFDAEDVLGYEVEEESNRK